MSSGVCSLPNGILFLTCSSNTSLPVTWSLLSEIALWLSARPPVAAALGDPLVHLAALVFGSISHRRSAGALPLGLGILRFRSDGHYPNAPR